MKIYDNSNNLINGTVVVVICQRITTGHNSLSSGHESHVTASLHGWAELCECKFITDAYNY